LTALGHCFAFSFLRLSRILRFILNFAFFFRWSLNTCVLEHFLAEVGCRGQPLTKLAGEGEGGGEGANWFVYKGG